MLLVAVGALLPLLCLVTHLVVILPLIFVPLQLQRGFLFRAAGLLDGCGSLLLAVTMVAVLPRVGKIAVPVTHRPTTSLFFVFNENILVVLEYKFTI